MKSSANWDSEPLESETRTAIAPEKSGDVTDVESFGVAICS
jgi:hypothetical protein